MSKLGNETAKYVTLCSLSTRSSFALGARYSCWNALLQGRARTCDVEAAVRPHLSFVVDAVLLMGCRCVLCAGWCAKDSHTMTLRFPEVRVRHRAHTMPCPSAVTHTNVFRTQHRTNGRRWRRTCT